MEVHFEDLKEEDLREVYDLCMETFQESFAFEEIEETFQLCRNDAHYRFLVGKSQEGRGVYLDQHFPQPV